MKKAGYLGQDTLLVNNALLTEYDTRITKALASPNALIFRTLLGVRGGVHMGVETLSWKYELGPYAHRISKTGQRRQDTNILYEEVTNKFLAINSTLNLKKEQIASAQLGGTDIVQETINAIIEKFKWMETYYTWNGGLGLTGIKSFTGIQDAGNPTGAWDDPTDVYADIKIILGKLDDIGWEGRVDLVMDSSLKKLFRSFIDDGTTTFETPVEMWIKGQLNGGTIWYNDYFIKDPATANTGLAYNAKVSDGANHVCIAIASHPENHVRLKEDVKGYNQPVQEGDVHRNYVEQFSVKVGSPLHFVFMNGIDETT
jgi:hypothetical protein